ncbi:hypothetical protein A5893_16100 [Pedobacter psychrophilus]|uniref:Uncharacterized protein n=1 Tax=Pedobacter psychrophilus TaxID=1826909 RepID=A0A179DC88_9SPHI|nr:hypothetical protein [Pedobacter psychrophilus]OAQ38310.1 hypothetical protein A5893_16100 [Pedobacter psychrophilus]
MDLQTRKIEFVKQFLTIENEVTISELEKVLHYDKDFDNNHFKPISIEELNKRIDQSEADIKNGDFYTSEELLAQYK